MEIHQYILNAFKKQSKYHEKGFNDLITKNLENWFTPSMLNAGQVRIDKAMEGYFLGYKYPDKYTYDGQSKFEKVQYTGDSVKQKEEIIVIQTFMIQVDKESDYINAYKEILWKLGNIPMTSKNILQYIVKLDSNGNLVGINQEDYAITNIQFQKAIMDNNLVLEISKECGKSIYKYKNPTDKRYGYYYKGSLLSLKELSNINGVKIVTLQRRISKGMPVHKAIQK